MLKWALESRWVCKSFGRKTSRASSELPRLSCLCASICKAVFSFHVRCYSPSILFLYSPLLYSLPTSLSLYYSATEYSGPPGNRLPYLVTKSLGHPHYPLGVAWCVTSRTLLVAPTTTRLSPGFLVILYVSNISSPNSLIKKTSAAGWQLRLLDGRERL